MCNLMFDQISNNQSLEWDLNGCRGEHWLRLKPFQCECASAWCVYHWSSWEKVMSSFLKPKLLQIHNFQWEPVHAVFLISSSAVDPMNGLMNGPTEHRPRGPRGQRTPRPGTASECLCVLFAFSRTQFKETKWPQGHAKDFQIDTQWPQKSQKEPHDEQKGTINNPRDKNGKKKETQEIFRRDKKWTKRDKD